MGKIVGVLSLKGGVGKTSSVVSIGAALSNLGKKVLLVDANFSLPNLGIHLKIIEPEKTIHDVLNRKLSIKEAVHNLEWFDVLPGHTYFEKEINPLKLRDHLRSLKKEYDVILVDSSPALNEETLATMLASDELFVVVTPDFSTIYSTIKAVNLAKKRGSKITGLILNKVYDKRFEIDLREIEKATNVPILAVIPHDKKVSKAQSNFVPFVFHRPKSKGSLEYHKLASLIIGEKYSPRRSLFSYGNLLPSRQEINREIFYESVFG